MRRRNFLKLSSSIISGTVAGAVGARTQRIGFEDGWSDQVSIAADYFYFNAGGLGPELNCSRDKTEAVTKQLRPKVDHGRRLIDEARPLLAQFLGCEPAELAFMRNTTEGNSTIAFGYRLEQGDEVILDSHAHQGGALPWLLRQKSDKIVLKPFEPSSLSPAENLERVEKLISRRTKLIQISHVTAPTGIRMPAREIGEIAKRRNIWFHLDGAQSAGVIPVSLADLGCDSFAACGHKWLCGPLESGFCYIRRERLEEIQPTEFGAGGEVRWNIPELLECIGDARRFECGTRNAATVVGLMEAIGFHQREGAAKIFQHDMVLANCLRKAITETPGLNLLSPEHEQLATPIVSFQVPGMTCDEAFKKLMSEGFRCRPIREAGLDGIRISPHFYNTLEQCKRLCEVIRELKD